MARWRDVKKGKTSKKEEPIQKEENLLEIICSSPLNRIKAFITDMFMIMMPIMYITTYVIMDGKDSFQGNESARWVTMAIFGAVTIAFWVLKGQTPGFKAYDIKLIDDKTNNPPGIILATLRYVIFLISAISIIGPFIVFFRKDKKTLQDLATGTSVVDTPR
jgi:uncharacterized RDD family membrane protein YckC